jgi:hypothetical protein
VAGIGVDHDIGLGDPSPVEGYRLAGRRPVVAAPELEKPAGAARGSEGGEELQLGRGVANGAHRREAASRSA